MMRYPTTIGTTNLIIPRQNLKRILSPKPSSSRASFRFKTQPKKIPAKSELNSIIPLADIYSRISIIFLPATVSLKVRRRTSDSTFIDRAESAADSAVASANFKGAWSSLTGALNIPASVTHNGYLWILLNNLNPILFR